MFPPLAERLSRAGFTAVTLNLSGSGVDDAGEFSLPDHFGRNTFSAEIEDLGHVLDALTSGGLGVPVPSSVGLIGHSRGGGSAVLQTSQDTRIRALVTWAAISTVQRWPAEKRNSWRASGRTEILNARTGQILPLYTDVLDDIERNAELLDIEAAAGRIRVPWLIVHGSADESVPYTEAEILRAASKQKKTRLLRVDGGGHTFGATHPWRAATPELETVFDATLGWLTANLD
jgi:uncharacterized protein